MEDVIARIFEYSLVGGAFLYLLHFVTNRLDSILNKIADKNAETASSMVQMSSTLVSVGNTLNRLDSRMEALERRVDGIEKGVIKSG